MKKIGAALIFSFLIISSINAQFRIAITGGAHQSSVIEENNNPVWDSVQNNFKPRTGIHFGVLADFPFSRHSVLYFQPGIIFTNKGRNYSAGYDTSFNTISQLNASQYVNYMDIPLNLVLKFKIGGKAKLIIGGGPYLSFFYSGKESTEILYKDGTFWSDEKKNLEVGDGAGQYKNFNYGLNGLFGFEFGPVFITGNYSRGFNDSYKDNTYTGTYRHQVIGGSIGILLGVSKKQKLAKQKDAAEKAEKATAKDKEKTKEKDKSKEEAIADKDGDGIPDKVDKCIDVKGLLKYNGCPMPDADKDGIADEEDKCPNVAGLSKYNGCPMPDADKDGVADEEDKCPNVTGSAKYNGCPIPDTDKDGVNDEEDRCPNVKGVKTNNGCPAIPKEIVKKVDVAARKIQFKYRSAKFTPVALQVLDQIVVVMKANPELRMTIEGHTSNDSNYFDNMKLSQMRANNVKKYMESKGIEPARLVAIGYGPSRPLNAGKTPSQKALNRRVELKLTNN